MISIIIPTRNRGEAFKRALDSALLQTVPCEIIVSDHNSTDGTEEYARQQTGVTYIRWPESINITMNWILGFMSSQGEWIKYVFDDDWLEADCCEKMMNLVEPHTTVVQCGASFAWNHQPVYTDYTRSLPIPGQVRSGILSVSPVTALIRRDALQKAWENLHYLSPESFTSGVGPNVLMNYITVAAEPQNMAYTPEILCHLDDLPGDKKSLTRHLRETNPDLLRDCHEEAYRFIDL